MRLKQRNQILLTHSLFVIACLTFVSSCTNLKGQAYEIAKQDSQIFTTPLREPKKQITQETSAFSRSESTQQQNQLLILQTPKLTVMELATQASDIIKPYLPDAQVSRLTFNNMPVGAFINEVFGNQLGLNFIVEPNVKNTPDLITMRITQTVSQKDLYSLATQTLKSYGVTTSLKDNVLMFDFSETAANGDIPLLISGRALPEVPSNSRPIFYIHTLTSVSPSAVRSWLSQMFPRKELDVKEDPNRNAIILNGSQNIVEQALAAAKLFDKPTMSGMYSSIIRPSLSSVTELSSNLEQVLKSEGFSVRTGDGSTAIRLLPLETVGQLIVFARSQEVLEHIINWTKTLEAKLNKSIENGLFSYQVQSTPATHIVSVLNSLGVANFSGTSNTNSSNNNSTGVSRTNTAIKRQGSSTTQNNNVKGRYAVDEQLNTILYSGSGKEWMQVLPIIKKLDKPAPSVMVEVILAEVTLTDSEETGLEWIAKSALGKFNLNFASSGSGLVTSVINNTLGTTVDSASQTRAIVNAFYDNKKANIRSRPRLMVKSGGEATINVGDKIPVLSQTSQSTDDANAAIVQTVNYLDTGVILSIKPTVHASGFIDIEIDQELSSATGDSLTPRISNRKLSTTVTLRDGGSVLLGGLISSTTSKGQTGVPILGRLPIIGKLFNTDSETQDRTELMVMIIPYVLNSTDEAEQLTDELQKSRIETLSQDIIK
jgi:general secretion pathway protein D